MSDKIAVNATTSKQFMVLVDETGVALLNALLAKSTGMTFIPVHGMNMDGCDHQLVVTPKPGTQPVVDEQLKKTPPVVT